jgi:hypothetical protein
MNRTEHAFDMLSDSQFDKALVISIPTIVKARNITPFGDRVVEVEASSEDVDSEGDRIVQKGLLEAASGFLARGHIDIDHISELGHRYGIKDASSYIIGRPTKVIDSGGARARMKCGQV